LGEHSDLAMRHALYAWLLHPELADAPLRMQEIALTKRDMGSSRDWFLRSIALRYDAWSAYQQFEWSLRPRWGGSVEEGITLAKACLKSERFDTGVPGFGLELLIRLQDQELGSTGSVVEDESVRKALLGYVSALDKAVANAMPEQVIPAD